MTLKTHCFMPRYKSAVLKFIFVSGRYSYSHKNFWIICWFCWIRNLNTFKNHYFSTFGIWSKKNTHNYLNKLLNTFFLFPTMYVCEDFLHILQMKQHITTDYETRIQLWSSKSDIKDICKDVEWCCSSRDFFFRLCLN